NVADSEIGILTKAFLDVVRAGNELEQARIGHGLVVGTVDQDPHFAPDPTEASWYRQHHGVVGVGVPNLSFRRRIKRLASKHPCNTVPRDIDLNTIGIDYDPAPERHKRRFDCFRRLGSELDGDLRAMLDQMAPRGAAPRFAVDDVEEGSGIGEERSKPVDNEA